MKYTWLFIDADGTLFDYDRAEAFALEETFRQFGAPFTPAHQAAYQQINARLWRELEQGLVTPAELRLRRFAELFTAFEIALDPAAFGEAYLDHLGACGFLIEGAAEMLAALHTTHKILVLTNGLSKVQRARLSHSPIQAYVDVLVISQEVGAAKPAPEIFDAAFAQAGNPPKTAVLMVGDSLTSDIQGGVNYGIDTCWFNPAGAPRPEGLPVTYEIRRLEELVGVVGMRNQE